MAGLVLGVRDYAITAFVIGVLYVKGMNPGPTEFLANPELIPFGFAAIGLACHILRTRTASRGQSSCRSRWWGRTRSTTSCSASSSC